MNDETIAKAPVNAQLAIALFAEISTIDQMMRGRLTKALPKGMALSHFSVLNYLAGIKGERTPAQLARRFNVTKAAMTNTLNRLEISGYIHIRPDWDDARQKFVAISPAGKSARDAAIAATDPIFAEAMNTLGADNIRAALPFLRRLRAILTADG